MNAIPAVTVSIVVAMITGLVTLLGLIITKENKVSELREAWISALREELASLVAHVNSMQAAVHASGGKSLWSAAATDFLGANRVSTSIRLRLNANEESSKALLTLLDRYEEAFHTGAPTYEDLEVLHRDMIAAARTLMKTEWDRVRHGEFTFRVAKGISFALLVAGSLFLAWAL